jgi:WD40 repeat protein
MTATFDTSGQRIITGSKDGFIRLWEMNPQVLADRICDYVDRELTEIEWAEYVGNVPHTQPTCIH